jgi:hypothetical protein
MSDRFIPHRTKEDSITKAIAFALLNIILLCIPMAFFYDLFVEYPYWNNRWKFRRHLKKNDVKIIHSDRINFKSGYHTDEIDIEIQGTKYKLWIWNDEDITLSSERGEINYIGLFTGDRITKWLKNDSVERLKKLVD